MNSYRATQTPARLRRALSLLALWLGILLLGLGTPEGADAAAGEVRVLTVEGVINPVTARYLVLGIDEATEGGDNAVLIELDTPGGLLDATHQITGGMLNARVPVIVYVTPVGTHAASAGTFITMAGHVAAMAPSTRIGAATPVAVRARRSPRTCAPRSSTTPSPTLAASLKPATATPNGPMTPSATAIRSEPTKRSSSTSSTSWLPTATRCSQPSTA